MVVTEISRRGSEILELHVQKSTLEEVLIELTAASSGAN